MKKIIYCSFVLVLIFSACASANIIGTLNRSNSELPSSLTIEKVMYVDNYINSLLARVIDGDFDEEKLAMKFYDSMTLMQLALNNGEISAISAPEYVGEYVLRNNSNYKLRGFIIGKSPIALAFGFLDEKKDLRDRFNKAVEDMEREGVIGMLARDFVVGPNADNPPLIEFEKFKDAETINVALTGDIPPIDYVGADGKPAGFNTAILAEIGRRLHVNIKPINVETGSRVMALQSGRADVVFWFQIFTGYDKQPDVPEGIITSTPYYGWNKTMLLGRK